MFLHSKRKHRAMPLSINQAQLCGKELFLYDWICGLQSSPSN